MPNALGQKQRHQRQQHGDGCGAIAHKLDEVVPHLLMRAQFAIVCRIHFNPHVAADAEALGRFLCALGLKSNQAGGAFEGLSVCRAEHGR